MTSDRRPVTATNNTSSSAEAIGVSAMNDAGEPGRSSSSGIRRLRGWFPVVGSVAAVTLAVSVGGLFHTQTMSTSSASPAAATVALDASAVPDDVAQQQLTACLQREVDAAASAGTKPTIDISGQWDVALSVPLPQANWHVKKWARNSDGSAYETNVPVVVPVAPSWFVVGFERGGAGGEAHCVVSSDTGTGKFGVLDAHLGQPLLPGGLLPADVVVADNVPLGDDLTLDYGFYSDKVSAVRLDGGDGARGVTAKNGVFASVRARSPQQSLASIAAITATGLDAQGRAIASTKGRLAAVLEERGCWTNPAGIQVPAGVTPGAAASRTCGATVLRAGRK